MAQRGHDWTQVNARNLVCVGASATEVGPKTGPMWAAWPCTNPHQSQKMLEIVVKNASLQRFALSFAQLAWFGPTWDRSQTRLGPTWAQVAPSWTQLEPKLALKLGPNRPRWPQIEAMLSHVMHMEVQVTPILAQLGALWPQLHTKLGPMEIQHGKHCFKRSVSDSKKTWKISMKTGVS